MMILTVIAMGIIGGILGLLGCQPQNSSNQIASNSIRLIADKIKMEGLPNELQKLKDGKTEFNFIGITSNGIDCVYFVKDGEIFQIELEAMVREQIPYIEKLKKFAESNGFKSSMTTYGNKPKYETPNEAPVILIETNSDLNNTVRIGRIIQKSIFNNTEETVYEVVP